MQEALDQAGIKDVTIKVGNCSYSGGEATYKVEVLLDGAETQKQSSLTQMASLMGLDTSKIAKISGQAVTLIGYNSKARKMPWQVRSLDGSRSVEAYRRSGQAYVWQGRRLMWYVATIDNQGSHRNQMWTPDRDNALDRASELLDAGYKVIIEEEIYSERS